ncbi:hypothetical protein ABPG72_002472 [Tetrahymena utriculariae]
MYSFCSSYCFYYCRQNFHQLCSTQFLIIQIILSQLQDKLCKGYFFLYKSGYVQEQIQLTLTSPLRDNLRFTLIQLVVLKKLQTMLSLVIVIFTLLLILIQQLKNLIVPILKITTNVGTADQNVKAIFVNHKAVNDDGNGGKLCKGVFVHGEQTACHNILQGNPQLEQQQQRLLRSTNEEDTEQLVRLLQAVPDAVSDPNGIRIFIQSSTDNFIDENGDAIVGVFDEQKPNPSKTNANELELGRLLILAAIFVI